MRKKSMSILTKPIKKLIDKILDLFGGKDGSKEEDDKAEGENRSRQ